MIMLSRVAVVGLVVVACKSERASGPPPPQKPNCEATATRFAGFWKQDLEALGLPAKARDDLAAIVVERCGDPALTACMESTTTPAAARACADKIPDNVRGFMTLRLEAETVSAPLPVLDKLIEPLLGLASVASAPVKGNHSACPPTLALADAAVVDESLVKDLVAKTVTSKRRFGRQLGGLADYRANGTLSGPQLLELGRVIEQLPKQPVWIDLASFKISYPNYTGGETFEPGVYQGVLIAVDPTSGRAACHVKIDAVSSDIASVTAKVGTETSALEERLVKDFEQSIAVAIAKGLERLAAR